MIFPLRVLGRLSVKRICSGLAKLPISCATHFRSSSPSSSWFQSPFFSVTKAATAWPVIALAVLYSLGSHGIMTLNDFKSVEGDRRTGIGSLPVRLGVGNAPLYLLSETCIERILEEIARLKPALVIIDSIQTVFSIKFQSAPGSIGQVREAATQFLFAAKGQNIPTVLVGHVTKDGNLAGPKALEHVVDTVLYFEGERHHSHRVVRAIKNRFGAVSELGVFEMTGTGLRPVANPSRLFLSERASGTPGSAVLCCVEGSRPILVEVQALVSTSTYGNARRMAIGIDQNRLSLLLAVLEKRAGLSLAGDDVYVNIAGGMSIEEPAADLSVVAAVASSVRNRGLSPSTAVFGEVGLSGEIRGIPQAPLRIREAVQMGFTRVVLPAANMDPSESSGFAGTSADKAECELVGVRTLGEALDELIA